MQKKQKYILFTEFRKEKSIYKQIKPAIDTFSFTGKVVSQTEKIFLYG